MKKLFVTISFLMLLALPLQIYNIPLGSLNFSLDRILLLGCLVLLPFFVRYIDKEMFLIIYLLSLSTLLSSLLATNESLLLKYFPSWIQSVLVFLISFILAKKGYINFKKLHNTHSFLLLFFVLYSFFFLYIIKTINFNYPFSSLLPDFQDDSHKLNQLYSLRIFFPFSSAPRLGFVLGFLLLAIPIKKHYLINNCNKKKDTVIAILLLFGIMLTISRGPIISLLLSLFVYHLLKLKDNLKSGLKYSLYILSGFIILAFIFSQYISLENFKFDRLLSFGMDDPSFEGHANVRLLAVNTSFLSPVLNLFFGYGIGHTQDVLDVSSAHSTYFTILIEQGLLGLFAFSSLFVIMILNAVKLYFNSRRKGLNSALYKYLVTISVFLTIIHVVYDATTLVILWAYNGLILGIIKYESNKIKNYNTGI